jgi:hypothetical protein
MNNNITKIIPQKRCGSHNRIIKIVNIILNYVDITKIDNLDDIPLINDLILTNKKIEKYVHKNLHKWKKKFDIDLDDKEGFLKWLFDQKTDRLYVKSLLNKLNPIRCNKYKSWINIGICLFNINNQYVDLWDEWSRTGSGYEAGCCQNKWKYFKEKNGGLNIGSLVMYSKDDTTIECDFI